MTASVIGCERSSSARSWQAASHLSIQAGVIAAARGADARALIGTISAAQARSLGLRERFLGGVRPPPIRRNEAGSGISLTERRQSRTDLPAGYAGVPVLKTGWATGPCRSAAHDRAPSNPRVVGARACLSIP